MMIAASECINFTLCVCLTDAIFSVQIVKKTRRLRFPEKLLLSTLFISIDYYYFNFIFTSLKKRSTVLI